MCSPPWRASSSLAGLLFVLMVLAISQLLAAACRPSSSTSTHLSAGDADPTARIPGQGHDELDNIALSVNRFIAFLQQMMVQVTAATDLITRELAQLDQRTGQARRILGNMPAKPIRSSPPSTNSAPPPTALPPRQRLRQFHRGRQRSGGQLPQGGSASASVVALIDEVDPPPPRCWRCRKMPSRSAACSG